MTATNVNLIPSTLALVPVCRAYHTSDTITASTKAGEDIRPSLALTDIPIQQFLNQGKRVLVDYRLMVVLDSITFAYILPILEHLLHRSLSFW